MIGIRRHANRPSLFASVAIVVVIAAVTDVALRALGWSQPPGEIWPAFAPRGAIIGIVWIVLFACMGAAHWIVARPGTAASTYRTRRIAVLIVACLAYPFYTHFIHGHLTELIGNFATLAIASLTAVKIWKTSPLASMLIALVALWIVFATVLVFALAGLNGWGTS